MKLSEKIQTLRKGAGLSQEQLAERLNVTRQAVSKWETGEGKPDIDTLLPLSRALHTTVDDLLDETVEAPQPHPRRDVPSGGFVEQCKALWRRWGYWTGYVITALGVYRAVGTLIALIAPRVMGILGNRVFWGAVETADVLGGMFYNTFTPLTIYYVAVGWNLLVSVFFIVGGLWLAKYLKRKYG